MFVENLASQNRKRNAQGLQNNYLEMIEIPHWKNPHKAVKCVN